MERKIDRESPRFPPRRVEEIVGESRAGGETSEEEKKKLLDKRESFAVARIERGQRGAVVENASSGSVFL